MTTPLELQKTSEFKEKKRKNEGYRGAGVAYHVSQSILGLTALAAVLVVGKLTGSDPIPWNTPRVSTTDVAPVVTEMRPRFWKVDPVDGMWVTSVFGTKGENQCVFVPNQKPTAIVSTQSPSSEISVSFVGDISPGSTKPPGKHYFNDWKFESDTLQSGDVVTTVLKHYCPGVGVVATTIGPWRVDFDGG